MGKAWKSLVIKARALNDPPEAEELLSGLLDDFSPAAIEDLAERPLPPGGLWDPTFPPIPEPLPTPLNWRVFFRDEDQRDAAARAVIAAFPSFTLDRSDIPDEDWAARSQKSLTAVRAGDFIVAPPWDLPADPAGATVIVIEPSMGFGTGHHATTRMCLRLLSKVDVAGKDVIDLGTGSGVLAMAAALKSARAVIAIDVDTDAIASAETSAKLNTLPDTIEFRVADFRSSSHSTRFARSGQAVGTGNLVLANLTGGMLTSAATDIARLIRPGGEMILSGFDHSEAGGVIGAFPGWTESDRLSEDNWIALRLRRP
jgi:ribosomal protein L11 methyltransferase